ncbi:AraC family transcriptional regulator [Paenibacillus sp. p3-SID867]|uniref:AraC family transcriptional regulator n=1 Tax=Paenibacillus sp. p3-SID867 TaxID=2916363 RepID=UPI0021A7BF0F|nr:AraC family transcriptional regulator [Paenibacillus sp. p3-SID867]MCT1400160.1 AraC family transcriptional regulator [Paenibacillus sp. p3-SID867]
MNGSLFQQMLEEGDYVPRFYAYYYKQWINYEMSYHQHDSTEIMYMISGVCRIDVKVGDTEKSLTLKKGEFMVLDADVPHRLIVEQAVSCRMLNVEFGFMETEGRTLSLRQIAGEEQEVSFLLNRPFSYLVLVDQEEVYPVLRSLVLELDQRGTEGRMMTHMLFIQLLVCIARLYDERERSEVQQSEFYIKRSVDFLHQNYDRNIQVKDVAAEVNLHPGYLHRVFRRGTGRTITEYLTMIRMEKAKMLLEQTDIPIHEISDYVGVGSRQYFHMLFKKYTETTPVEFRLRKDRNAWKYGDQEAGADKK